MVLPVDLLVGNPGAARNLKNEDDLNLRMTRDPHGDATLTWDLCNWTGQLPRMRDNVTVRHPVYGVIWSGYLGAPTLPHPVKGGAIKCVARGWRQSILDDGWDVTKVWTQGTPLLNVVQEALSKCSHIGAGVPLPGGLAFQLAQDSQDFINRTPDDVFDFVQSKFSHLTTPLLWEIKQHAGHPFSEDPSFHMRFTDTAPRYFIRLTEKDEFNPTYDSDTVFNKGIVGWSPKLAETTLVQPAAELYKVIPHIRAKRMNGSVDLATQQEAMNLGQYLVSRNNTLRPVNTVLKVHCDTAIRAVYPVVPSETNSVPHEVVRNNYVIRILNDLSAWGPYGAVTDFWISDVEYDWDTGSLRLSLGDPIAYDDFELQQSYNSNRAAVALNSGVVSEPLRDADVVPVIGPDKAGDTPPSIGEVITMGYLDQTGALISTTDITKPSVPHGGVVHPTIIPDYGVQANFGREANSLGIKGYIRVIPCKLLDWTLDFIPAPGSDSIPTGNLTVQLYGTYPFVPLSLVLATISISSAQGASGTFGSPHIFAQGGKVGVRVSVAKTDAGAIGFQLGLGGKKLYPHMGVTS